MFFHLSATSAATGFQLELLALVFLYGPKRQLTVNLLLLPGNGGQLLVAQDEDEL